MPRGLETLLYTDLARVDAGAGGVWTERLAISIKSGDILELPVRGRDGKFNDAMQMMRFLNRAAEDVA